MITARKEVATARVGDFVVVASGSGSDNNPSVSSEVYSITSDAWSATGPIGNARRYHLLVAVGSDVLALGGVHLGNLQGMIERLSLAPLLHPAEELEVAARGVAALALQWSNSSLTMQPALWGMAVVANGLEIIVAGGATATSAATAQNDVKVDPLQFAICCLPG